MRIDVLTLFPEMLRPMLSQSILGRAIEAGLIEVQLTDIRSYTQDRHRRTDDYPFGGGAGMVMFPQPICDAVRAVDPEHTARRIYMSPRGRTLDQRYVEELGRQDHILLLCGHYEGVDQRALDLCVDEELSVGDYVLTGGELGALIVIDAVSRMVPGVLGSAESAEDESFSMGLLEYPQYTRPAVYEGLPVPEVLLGGRHADIEAWRREQSLELTRRRRPELLDTAPLTDRDRLYLQRIERAEAAIARLRERGIEARRADPMQADGFERAWLLAFVPESTRKAARKRCTPSRGRGGLELAYTEGFAVPCTRAALPEDAFVGENLCWLPKERVLLRVKGELPGDPDCVLTDAELRYTRLGDGSICGQAVK